MRLRGFALLLLAGIAAAADLETALGNLDRRTARSLVALVREADQAGQRASARAISERILAFDPDHSEARALLGFSRRRGAWSRPAEREREVAGRSDADPAAGAALLERAAQVEEHHRRELVRLCGRYGTLEEKRRHLLPLLDRFPRDAAIHETLGHRRVGPDYVRPELMRVVRRMPEGLAAWRACADADVEVEPAVVEFPVPGIAAAPECWRAGPRRIASTLPQAPAIEIARHAARCQALLRLLLGEKTEVWDPPVLVFLDAGNYKEMLRAICAGDEEQLRLHLRFDNYEHRDFLAIRTWSAADAADRYAHGAGYWTLYALAAPQRRDGSREALAYPWLFEGFGYLLSLELFDRGHMSFVSLEESAAKMAFTRPPPAQRTRAACLGWLKEQVLAGRAYPLREVCSKSLNTLDFCASMQAWSFLRFLFLHDPDAARLLPRALARRSEGSRAERADDALRGLLGGGIEELERLWRPFLLEITQD